MSESLRLPTHAELLHHVARANSMQSLAKRMRKAGLRCDADVLALADVDPVRDVSVRELEIACLMTNMWVDVAETVGLFRAVAQQQCSAAGLHPARWAAR